MTTPATATPSPEDVEAAWSCYRDDANIYKTRIDRVAQAIANAREQERRCWLDTAAENSDLRAQLAAMDEEANRDVDMLIRRAKDARTTALREAVDAVLSTSGGVEAASAISALISRGDPPSAIRTHLAGVALVIEALGQATDGPPMPQRPSRPMARPLPCIENTQCQATVHRAGCPAARLVNRHKTKADCDNLCREYGCPVDDPTEAT
jgi:hypothetical protein